MDEHKATLLIVEDDLDIADMLNAYFRIQGYEVQTINWGADAIRACQLNPPDLVILDICLPDEDGFEVARQLKENHRTSAIPIIFLTEKRERVDRLRGLGLQAVDYITKPFGIQELHLRVRNTLLFAQRGSFTNPVTGLPEGSLVDEFLGRSLNEPGWGLVVIGIKHFDQFREIYGSVAADDLVRAVVLMLKGSLQSLGTPEDQLGHLGATDFVILTRLAHLAALRERIGSRLEQSFENFYGDQDRKAGNFGDRPLTLLVQEISPETVGIKDLEALKKALQAVLSDEHKEGL